VRFEASLAKLPGKREKCRREMGYRMKGLASVRCLRPAAGGLAAVALILFAAVAPAQADKVAIRAADHEGYGRFVFDWPAAVSYTAATEGSNLVIHFQRPIEANLSSLARSLGKYVGEAKVGDDGASVVVGLKGEFGLRHFLSGNSVVVDLMETKPAAAAPTPTAAAATPAAEPAKPAAATPAPSTPAPADAPVVGIRTGEHDDYTRIVFDWTSKVGYKLDRNGTTATLRFDKPAKLGVSGLQSRPPKFVANVSTSAADGGTTFTITVPENSALNAFLSDTKVVLDVKAPGPNAVPPTQTANAAPVVAPKPEAPPAAAPAALAPAPAPVRPTAESGAASASTATSSTAALAPAGEPPAASEAGPEPQGQAAKPAEGTENKPTSLIANANPTGDAAPAEGAPAEAAPSRPAPVPGAPPLVRDVIATPVQGGGVSLRFDWKEPTAAAVFRRAGALWVIFDRALQVDVDKLRQAGGNAIRSIQKVPAQDATALRIDTVAGINPQLKRNGLAWILDFAKQPIQVATQIDVNAQTNSPVGARVFMPVSEPANAVAVVDPDVKDTLVVVPVVQLGQGLGQLRDYPQFTLLPTAQGLVIKPKIDDLRVRSLPQGIELSSTIRLQISPVTAELAASANVAPIRPLTHMFELERDGREALADLAKTRQKLQLDIAKATGPARERARQRLARFYFANGFNAEALGVLDAMISERAELANEPEFLGTRGAASVLLGRFKEAHADLEKTILEDNDEAEFWRAVLRASEGDLVKPAPVFKRLGSLLRPYPKAIKMPVGMLMVDSSIAVGDLAQGQRFLELLNAEQQSPTQKAQIAFLTGKLKAVAGDYDGAVALWEQVLTSKHRPSIVKATVGRDELLLRLGRKPRAEVIDDYDKLRYIWRGDEFEFNLLRRLGRLQLEEGQYREGLRTLRQAATYFRDNSEVGQITQLMAESFANIFLGDALDRMPAVAAVALYDEFKELTPAGARGDAVIRRLADKLASIELYDRAAEFLESQVQFRLKGVEKATVGTRLAVIYFLNRKLDKSMETLNKTEEPGMPDELKKARLLLRARLFEEMDKPADALALLKEDKSIEGDMLRLEVYWSHKDWVNAALTQKKLLESTKAEADKPLDPKQSAYVLNLAIALTLSGNERGVSLLRRDYGQAMANTPNKDAFLLIAAPESPGLTDYRTIADKVSLAEKFSGFMLSYRQKLQSEFKQAAAK
jgi:hypothetical protein